MKIHHVAISVRDLERSAEFYRRFFGFREVNRFERKDLKWKSLFMESDGICIELWQFENIIANKDDFLNLAILGIKHIAFGVLDVDKKYAELKSKGLDVEKPRMGASGGRYCFLKDPDGFPIEIYQVHEDAKRLS